MELKAIAHIHTDFPEKFGIPRQSGIVESLEGRIVFEKDYKDPQCIRGLEEFSHIWLLWGFDGIRKDYWCPVVTPPRLGGKVRMGVFATRSPYRPNPIGLSSVKIKKIEITEEGPVIYVLGADLRDNTPIYDIKPYLPYTDIHAEAKGGFSDEKKARLKVVYESKQLEDFPKEKVNALIGILAEDPRPAYKEDGTEEYGVFFAGFNVRFVVEDNTLRIISVIRLPQS